MRGVASAIRVAAAAIEDSSWTSMRSQTRRARCRERREPSPELGSGCLAVANTRRVSGSSSRASTSASPSPRLAPCTTATHPPEFVTINSSRRESARLARILTRARGRRVRRLGRRRSHGTRRARRRGDRTSVALLKSTVVLRPAGTRNPQLTSLSRRRPTLRRRLVGIYSARLGRQRQRRRM